MPYRVAETSLNASTLDILNVIRQNASYEYQSLVPQVTQATDIPKVGEVLYGHPALANQFINALINRIASVRVKSATFNNPYADLKKGYLAFGETVEEVFVEIAKAVEFSAEKGAAREFKRTLPDVRSAFHVMNYRVMYPVTIQDEDLRMAFTSIDGVQDLIAKIVNAVYTAQEYDEYLLFKYMLIKGINAGSIKAISGGLTDSANAILFRGTSNKLEFMSTEYNMAHVHTNTKKRDQYIFMSAEYNAQFDVNVLASAFNMDKADFMGRLKLVDDWTTFDNERFDIIRANSDGLEAVTDAELTVMNSVVAILIDSEWFQVYDNNNKFTEKYVASGLYWNYFYHVWKTISWSPFSNAVVFMTAPSAPETLTATIDTVSTGDGGKVVTVHMAVDGCTFPQTEELTELGVAVSPYGSIIIPAGTTIDDEVVEIDYLGTAYFADLDDVDDAAAGGTVTFSPASP